MWSQACANYVLRLSEAWCHALFASETRHTQLTNHQHFDRISVNAGHAKFSDKKPNNNRVNVWCSSAPYDDVTGVAINFCVLPWCQNWCNLVQDRKTWIWQWSYSRRFTFCCRVINIFNRYHLLVAVTSSSSSSWRWFFCMSSCEWNYTPVRDVNSVPKTRMETLSFKLIWHA